MVGDLGEPASPQNDLGASPLNSLNLTTYYSTKSHIMPHARRPE